MVIYGKKGLQKRRREALRRKNPDKEKVFYTRPLTVTTAKPGLAVTLPVAGSRV